MDFLYNFFFNSLRKGSDTAAHPLLRFRSPLLTRALLPNYNRPGAPGSPTHSSRLISRRRPFTTHTPSYLRPVFPSLSSPCSAHFLPREAFFRNPLCAFLGPLASVCDRSASPSAARTPPQRRAVSLIRPSAFSPALPISLSSPPAAPSTTPLSQRSRLCIFHCLPLLVAPSPRVSPSSVFYCQLHRPAAAPEHFCLAQGRRRTGYSIESDEDSLPDQHPTDGDHDALHPSPSSVSTASPSHQSSDPASDDNAGLQVHRHDINSPRNPGVDPLGSRYSSRFAVR